MPEIMRVRSGQPTIAALIARGNNQSPTFRRLVETINASEGIVYIEEGRCRGGARACLKSVVKSGQNRILLVWISKLRKGGDDDTIATIGHDCVTPSKS